MTSAPLYGMTDAQERRFFALSDHLRALGYWVSSEPLEGMVEDWLAGIEKSLARLNERLTGINKAYRTRGRSKAARYYLTSNDRFDPGFGLSLTSGQIEDNAAYAAELARGVARWNAAFGEGE